MPFLETDKGKIFFAELGSGPPLLLLRGLGRSSRYWLGFEEILANSFHVILMDQRGLGRTSVPAAWTDSTAELARDVLDLMDHLDIQAFHVFGLSLGGMIALELAATAPRRILSMIVANSSSQGGWSWRINPCVLPSLIYGGCRGRFHQSLVRVLLGSSTKEELVESILKKWQDIREDEGFPLLTIAKQLCMAHRFSVGALFQESSVPIRLLILSGDRDRLVPARNSDILHSKLPGSLRMILRGAGHEIAVQHENELEQIIQDFSEELFTAKGTV